MKPWRIQWAVPPGPLKPKTQNPHNNVEMGNPIIIITNGYVSFLLSLTKRSLDGGRCGNLVAEHTEWKAIEKVSLFWCYICLLIWDVGRWPTTATFHCVDALAIAPKLDHHFRRGMMILIITHSHRGRALCSTWGNQKLDLFLLPFLFFSLGFSGQREREPVFFPFAQKIMLLCVRLLYTEGCRFLARPLNLIFHNFQFLWNPSRQWLLGRFQTGVCMIIEYYEIMDFRWNVLSAVSIFIVSDANVSPRNNI